VTLENKPEEEEKALYCGFHPRSRFSFFYVSECFLVAVTTYHFSATSIWTIFWDLVVTSTKYHNNTSKVHDKNQTINQTDTY
jgi:hypothetical protein